MKLLEPNSLAALIGATPPDAPNRNTSRTAKDAGSSSVLPFAQWPTGRGLAFNSAMVRQGDVFIALQGASGHGIDHAPQALARGAAFIVSDRPHPMALLVADARAALRTLGRAARERLTAPVIGITGSAGKTTTKTFVTHALAARSTPGNLNTPAALVAALVEAALMDTETDPAACNHGALVGPGGAGSQVVLELGIDAIGEMDELVDLTSPDHALITTIGEAHLAALKDRAMVAREKARLLERVPGLRLVGATAAQHLSAELRSVTTATTLTGLTDLATGMQAVVTGTLSERGMLTALGASATLPWPGMAMAENALLALALAVRLGRDPQAALDAIIAAPLEHSRLERLRAGDVAIIDDSYNANPLSVALALEVLRAEPAPLVAFLGDMRELGDVSRQRHRELGAATTDLDMVVAIGPAAAAIRDANPSALLAADAADASRYLDRIPAGATVLVKGSRSLELERLVDALLTRFGGTRDTAARGAAGGGGAPAGGGHDGSGRTEVSSW